MDPKSSRQLPATSPSARAADPGAPLERRAAPQPVRRPSRTASGELARTAPGVVRTNWCGGAASSARSTGLPSVRNGAPQGFLWSFSPVSLSGGVLSAVAGFLLCAGFFRRSPATRATGLRTPPQKKKNTDRLCGHPLPALPVRGLPALRVLVLLLPVFRRRHSWQPRKRIRRNGAYVTMKCPRPFGGSWPTYSMQHWSPKY